MNLEVLVASMNREKNEIIKEMNIQTDAIIINQCEKWLYEEINKDKSTIRFISCNEKGVGLSRNNALMRSHGDIILFADEDEVFEEDYEKKVLSEFEKYQDADIIFFNVQSLNEDRPIDQITKEKRMRLLDSMRFGTVRIAAKRKRIIENNIFFSLLFGGGAKYGSGEDSLFIKNCFDKKLKAYSSTKLIAKVKQDESTWFKGYNEKYFIDKGILYRKVYGKWAIPMCIQTVIRHFKHENLDKSLKTTLKAMIKGANKKI